MCESGPEFGGVGDSFVCLALPLVVQRLSDMTVSASQTTWNFHFFGNVFFFVSFSCRSVCNGMCVYLNVVVSSFGLVLFIEMAFDLIFKIWCWVLIKDEDATKGISCRWWEMKMLKFVAVMTKNSTKNYSNKHFRKALISRILMFYVNIKRWNAFQ